MSRLRFVFAWVLVTIVLGFVVHADDRAGDDWTVVVAENVGGPVIESTKYLAQVMGESLGRSVPVVKETQWGGRGHAVFVGDVAAAVTAGLTQGNLAYEESAEKLRLLKEKGGLVAEIGALSEAFDRSRAMENEVDFRALRKRTLDLVNQP